VYPDPVTGEGSDERTRVLARNALELLHVTDPPPPAIASHTTDGAILARAQDGIALLQSVLPTVRDEAQTAELLHEMGRLLSYPLGETQVALESLRQAHRRRRAPHIARDYYKAAVRADSLRDALDALEALAEQMDDPTHRARLLVARGALLEAAGDPHAARGAYTDAAAQAEGLEAHEALERLAADAGAFFDAAGHARRLAATSRDAALRAEHLVRAAMHLEAVGGEEALRAASELATQARVHAPESPSVVMTLERLVVRREAWGELVSLREEQIRREWVDPAAGWIDVGVVSRYLAGDAERARRAFAAARDALTDDATVARRFVLRELGELDEARGDAGALAEVEEARADLLEDPSERAEAWTRIAHARDRLGDPEGAAKAFETALAIDRAHGPALRGVGRLYQRLGSRERLLRLHRHEAESATDPRDRAAASLRAGELLAEDDENLDEAIEMLRRAVEAMPTHLSALASLERALQRKKDWSGLLRLHQRRLEHERSDGRRAWILAQIGRLAADHLGDRDPAIAAFREAAELDVTAPPEPLLRLAQLLEEAGELSELAGVLSRLADRTPDPARAASLYERLASVHERLGDDDSAVATYRRALAIAPESHPVFKTAARAFLAAGRYEELLSLYDAIAESSAGEARAEWCTRGAEVLDRYMGRPGDALKHLRRAVEAAPEHPGARRALHRALAVAGRWDHLARLAGPSDARAAVVAEATGDHSLAAERYAALNDPSFGLALGRVLWRTGDEVALAASLGGATDAHARYRAATFAARRGEDATGAFLEAAGSGSEAETLPSQLVLSRAAPARAERALATLAQTSDPVARAAYHRRRAALLEALGRVEEALELRRAALAAEPEDLVTEVRVELALERADDREGLAAHLVRAIDATRDDASRTGMLVSLGGLLESLGRHRDAATRWNAPSRRRAAAPEPARSSGASRSFASTARSVRTRRIRSR